ncbi:MAG: FkbM family methyltransferase [Nostocales cyanobacterium]|nr:MAG: FkbM family methyltransferase [Nostocales cyanobacterium]TAF12717.1 MAG: FkbM family methyltransferase [Nostocales cyanobacterium]
MKSHPLDNGMKVFCLQPDEVQLTYQEVQNYLKYGIELKAGDTVFDIGANIGLFTVWLSHKFQGEINIYSFEPIPEIYQVLNANVQSLNNFNNSQNYQTYQTYQKQNAKVFNCGLAEKSGDFTFTYYPKMSVGSTAYPMNQAEINEWQNLSVENIQNFPPPICYLQYLPSFLLKMIIQYKLNTGFQGKQVTCQLKTVSQIIEESQIEKIDLLKVDVEKSELDVLLGIENKDWGKIKQVFVEVHDINDRVVQISDLLKNQGFANIKVEQEAILNGSDIFSLYAWR